MIDNSSQELPWTIYPHPWRIARIALFSSLFVIAGIFLIVAPPLRPSVVRETFQTITGVAGLALGVIGIAVPFYSLIIRRKPVVTLDPQGLIFSDNTLIQWREIKRTEPYRLFGNNNLTISLTESSPHYNRRPHVELGFAFASTTDYNRAIEIINQMMK